MSRYLDCIKWISGNWGVYKSMITVKQQVICHCNLLRNWLMHSLQWHPQLQQTITTVLISVTETSEDNPIAEPTPTGKHNCVKSSYIYGSLLFMSLEKVWILYVNSKSRYNAYSFQENQSPFSIFGRARSRQMGEYVSYVNFFFHGLTLDSVVVAKTKATSSCRGSVVWQLWWKWHEDIRSVGGLPGKQFIKQYITVGVLVSRASSDWYIYFPQQATPITSILWYMSMFKAG